MKLLDRAFTARHEAALRYLFDGFEADAGLRSTYVDALGRAMSIPSPTRPPALLAAELYACWARRHPASRTHAALVSMLSEEGGSLRVTVLHRRYGPRTPDGCFEVFGVLAGVIRFTSIVESLSAPTLQMAIEGQLANCPPRADGESLAAWDARRKAARDRRFAFVREAMAQAQELVDDAGEAFARHYDAFLSEAA